MKDYPRYFLWLMEQIPGINRREAMELYNQRFYSVIPNDENRAEDGLVLRENYTREKGEKLPGKEVPCTVLEMMIALSFKIVDIMYGKMDDEINTASRWFGEMLDHLGRPRDRQKWDRFRWNDACDTLVNRTYDENGKGGLFPRISPDKDQRKVEIWYQMNGYLMDWYT